MADIAASSRVPVDAAFFIRAARLLRDELPLLCDARVRGVADIAPPTGSGEAGGSRLVLTASALDSMLSALAEYVCLPAYALTVARYFKPALMEIFARATVLGGGDGGPSLEERALAFGRVVTVYPRVLPLIVAFLARSQSLFENVALAASAATENSARGKGSDGKRRRNMPAAAAAAAAAPSDTAARKRVGARSTHFSLGRPQMVVTHPQRLRQIAEAARRLVAADPAAFSALWNWGPFYSLMDAADAATRFHARQAIAIRSGCMPMDRSPGRSEESQESPPSPQSTPVSSADDYDSRCLLEEALAYVHTKRGNPIANLTATTVDTDLRQKDVDPIFSDQLHSSGVTLRASLLSVCGVTLERSSSSTPSSEAPPLLDPEDIMVATRTVRANMSALAKALCQPDPVLLSGAQGSGKTTMLRHLAHHLGLPPLVELHIDDQMDIKTLLGTYVCSDLPGEFHWQPGVLTQAVLAGRWVVIDDIDRAPFDVLSSLTDLIENRALVLPGAGEVIHAKKSFRLFATRSELEPVGAAARRRKDASNRVDDGEYDDDDESRMVAVASASLGGNAQISKFLDSYWVTVRVVQQSAGELASILSIRYNVSHRAAAKMVRTFDNVRYASQQLRGLRRVPTLRDLLLWCHRVRRFGHLLSRRSARDVNKDATQSPHAATKEFDTAGNARNLTKKSADLFDPASEEDAFLTQQEREGVVIEALDCFCRAAPSKEDRVRLARIVARVWDVDADGLVRHMGMHRPQIDSGNGQPEENDKDDDDIDMDVSGAADGSAPPPPPQEALISIGRVTLPVLPRSAVALSGTLDGPGSANKFAYTGAALRLLESLSACVAIAAPVLLVGETGCGKTTVVQHLAECVGQKLVVQNLNIQSDTTDLLGGFKPVDIATVARPLVERFVELFQSSFPANANAAFVVAIRRACAGKKWKKLEKGLLKAVSMAKLQGSKARSRDVGRNDNNENNDSPSDASHKRSKGNQVSSTTLHIDEAAWEQFEAEVRRFSKKRSQIEQSFVFAFVEGALVQALRNGHWVLLDEINLASPETLQRISSLLDNGARGTIVLTENGEIRPVERHPNFRLFAAMNPATDVGKRDLPPALRSRFSELYVDEVTDAADLAIVIEKYMRGVERPPIDAIVQCYVAARALSERSLFDGAGRSPKYSLRTLCRALEASRIFYDRRYRLERSLFEGHSMSFLTQLEPVSAKKLRKLLVSSFCSKMRKKDLRKAPGKPGGKKRGGRNEDWVVCQRVWLPRGPLDCVDDAEPNPDTGRVSYVMTESVKENLYRLCCCVAVSKYPVLLQGPTSSGKTTMVMYLARLTGHRCVRINNHEHTDLQEYMGSYVSDSSGRLVFKEGLLVEAVRKGYWIVLDELNLAPSEVLEALNRLLDDNRELFIPETQEIVRPHPNFMIFGTQNPPGVYGGRKILSRAFRNRFLELHVDDIPNTELETILQNRCSLAPSYCRIVIAIMTDLQRRRANTSLFAGKHGFITTRDLLRWGNRGCHDKRELADQGFMLLGDRLRAESERHVVKQVIEKHCLKNGQTIDEDKLYSGKRGALREYLQARDTARKHRKHPAVNGKLGAAASTDAGVGSSSAEGHRLKDVEASTVGKVSLTRSLERVFTLVGNSVEKLEPVLLVGGTGCGKTTACQLLAEKLGRPLYILNCHQHTETSDILGGLRPVRGRERSLMIFREHVKFVFEWIASGEGAAWLRGAAGGDEERVEAMVADWIETVQAPTDFLTATSGSAMIEAVSLLKELRGKVEGCSFAISLPAPNVDGARSNGVRSNMNGKKNRWAHIQKSIGIALEHYTNYMSLFRWHDGPLVQAMREGSFILLDEISLAEDAVLERLNSVLEPSRTLTLAEKGGDVVEEIVAHPEFRIFATMNPGGDFGKKELSPALRNRFTEIWVPEISEREDLMCIISEQLKKYTENQSPSDAQTRGDMLMSFVEPMLDFVTWFNSQSFSPTKHSGRSKRGTKRAAAKRGNESASAFFMTLRDILSWVDFVGTTTAPTSETRDNKGPSLKPWSAYMHGAALVVLDGLGLGAGLSDRATSMARDASFAFLLKQAPANLRSELIKITSKHRGKAATAAAAVVQLDQEQSTLKFGMFSVALGPHANDATSEQGQRLASEYALHAPTPSNNLMRVMRSLQLNKPILLEGSPGVGKSSLIATLAAMTGHRLLRINLSEQTDIADLLGADLPVGSSKKGQGGGVGADGTNEEDGAATPQFQWCDGVFLQALRAGDWVLLDELNLAPQSVLEGLNACLDHRAEVYIPEIDKTFDCPPSFRIFATQNPLQEGGGRKGLPRSFLNRFTKVYVETLKFTDLVFITGHRFRTLATPNDFDPEAVVAAASGNLAAEASVLQKMITFNVEMHNRTMRFPKFGRHGAPWDFNLRDVFRWCALASSNLRYRTAASSTSSRIMFDPLPYIDIIYVQRMRHKIDRDAVLALCKEVFGRVPVITAYPRVELSPTCIRIGSELLSRASIDPASESVSNIDQFEQRQALSQPLRQPPRSLSRPMSHIMTCVKQNWPCLLVGPTASGKTTSLRWLAAATSSRLHEVSLSKATDAADLLGCFEQTYPNVVDKGIFNLVVSASESADRILINAKSQATGKDENELCSKALKTIEENRWALQKALSNHTRRIGNGTESGKLTRYDQGRQIRLALQLLRSLRAALGPIGRQPECRAVMNNLAVVERELAKHGSAVGESAVGPAEAIPDGQGKPFFEWKDGVLVKAVEAGDWLILEHANLCSATVLDRLNSLMEDNGELLLSECGTSNDSGEEAEDADAGGQKSQQAHGGRIVARHPNFRLFLTMDPAFGEISRPMRNRCIEISFLDPIENHMAAAVVPTSNMMATALASFSSVRFDCIRLLQFCGIVGSGVSSAMFSAHARAAARLSHGGASSGHFSSYLSLRHLRRWGLDVASRVRRGDDAIHAIRASFVSLYPGVTLRAKTTTSNGISTSLSEADILVSALCEVTDSLDGSIISTPDVWPRASALTSSSFLSVDPETQRDLALAVDTLQFALASALTSYLSTSDSIIKSSDVRAFFSSNAGLSLALPGAVFGSALSNSLENPVAEQRLEALATYPPKHLRPTLFGEIRLGSKCLPIETAAVEAILVFARSCSIDNFRFRLHVLGCICKSMLPRGEDDQSFVFGENGTLSIYFMDMLKRATDFATDVFTCSLAQEIQHGLTKLGQAQPRRAMRNLLSHVASRLSPDMTLSHLWNSLEPQLLAGVDTALGRPDPIADAEEIQGKWVSIQTLSKAWRLLQDQAAQRAAEASFYRGSERKTVSESHINDPTSTACNNALELSYMISKGKRHRGDIPSIVCMLFPLLHAIDAATFRVFLDAETVREMSVTTSDDLNPFDAFAELVQDMLQTRKDAFNAFQKLPTFADSNSVKSMDVEDSIAATKEPFDYSEQYLCIVLHLSWLVGKSQHAINFYKKVCQTRGAPEGDRRDTPIIHLEQTVAALKQHMTENGIMSERDSISANARLKVASVDEAHVLARDVQPADQAMSSFAPRLWSESGPPCASQCVEVATARSNGRDLSAVEAGEFNGTVAGKSTAGIAPRRGPVLSLAHVLGDSNARGITSHGNNNVRLVSVLNTDSESRRELMEGICSVEWANCELLHLWRPSERTSSQPSARASSADVSAAINRIGTIQKRHDASHAEFHRHISSSLTSVTVKDPSLGDEDAYDDSASYDESAVAMRNVVLSSAQNDDDSEHLARAVSTLQDRWSRAHLWPAAETWCLRKEQALMSEILFIRHSLRVRLRASCQEDNEDFRRHPLQPRLETLLVDTREWIEVMLTHTCRPVSNLVPYQHLIWAASNLHSVDTAVVDAARVSTHDAKRNAARVKVSRIYIEKFMSRMIPEISHGHLRRCWTLPSSANRIDPTLSLLGAVHLDNVRQHKMKQAQIQLMQRQSRMLQAKGSGVISEVSPVAGATVLLRAVNTETVVSLLRGVGGGGSHTAAEGVDNPVSIDDRDPKLSQLRALAVWIGKDGVKPEVLERSKLSILWHTFVHIVHTFIDITDQATSTTALSNIDWLGKEFMSSGSGSEQHVDTSLEERYRSCVESLRKSSRDERFASLFDTLVEPTIKEMFGCVELMWEMDCSNAQGFSYSRLKQARRLSLNLARLSVLVPLLQFHLLTPTSNVDPATEPAIRCSALASRRDAHYKSLLTTYMQNVIVSGGPSGPVASAHSAVISESDRETSILRKHIVYRPRNNRAFAILVRTICKMSSTLLSVSAIDKLVRSVQTSGASREESEWQSSMRLSAEKVSSEFGIEYNDVVTPILAAVYDIKYGISLLRHCADTYNATAVSSRASNRDWLQEVAQHMLTLPSLRIENLQAEQRDIHGNAAVPTSTVTSTTSRTICPLLACESTAIERLRAASRNGAAATRHMFHVAIDTTRLAVARKLPLPMSMGGGRGLSDGPYSSMSNLKMLESVHRLFSAFVENWNEARDEEERKQAFNASLFRSKTAAINQLEGTGADKIATDSEAEAKQKEQEFRSLFPDMYASYKDLFTVDQNDLNKFRGNDAEGSTTEIEALESERANKKFRATSEDSERLSEAHAELFRQVVSVPGIYELSTRGLQRKRGALARAVMEQSFDVLGHFGDVSSQGSALSNFEAGALESEGFYTPAQLYLVCRAILVCAGRRASKEEEEDDAREEVEAEALARAITEAEETLEKESAILGTSSSSSEASSVQSAASLALAKLRNKESLRTKSRLRARHGKFKKKTDFYQFQTHPCVREVRKITLPVRALADRISTLLRMLPDNTLLVQISRVCTRLLLLPVTSPLPRVLTGVEILLSKCQEWQSVSSSSRTTLADLMKDLSMLVIRWRKIELRSWPSLLDNEEVKFRTAAAKWWPHLYSVVNVGFDASGYAGSDSNAGDCTGMSVNIASSLKKWLWMRIGSSETTSSPSSSSATSKGWVHPPLWEAGDKYLLELFENVKMFLHCSSFGDFEARLDLIEGFAKQCRAEAVSGYSQFAPPRVRLQLAVMFENIQKIYKLLLPAVQQARSNKRLIIEKKLKEQAKLARWDEQTYYSLRESSDRSHRALFRLVTEFRGVLRTPCSPVFESLMTTGGLSALQGDVDANAKATLSVAAWSTQLTKSKRRDIKARVGPSEASSRWFGVSVSSSNVLSDALEETPGIYLRAQTAAKAEKFTEQLLTSHRTSTSASATSNIKINHGENQSTSPARASWASAYGVSHVENITTMIIRRVAHLAGNGGGEKDQPKPTKMAKKLALVRLLEILKEEEFTHSMGKVPPSMSYLHSLCAVPIPILNVVAASDENEDSLDKLASGSASRAETPLVRSMSKDSQKAVRSTWNRADSYHYRCILQLQNLRQQVVAGAISADINTKETRVMHGVSENLMLNTLRTRQNLASAVESFDEMSRYIGQIERWRSTIEAAKPSFEGDKSTPRISAAAFGNIDSLHVSNAIASRQALLLRLLAVLEDIAQIEGTASRAAQVQVKSQTKSSTDFDDRPSCGSDIASMIKAVKVCLESIEPHCDSLPGPTARNDLYATTVSLEGISDSLGILIARLDLADSATLPLPTMPLRKMRASIQSSLSSESGDANGGLQKKGNSKEAVAAFVAARNYLLERSLLQIQRIKKTVRDVHTKRQNESSRNQDAADAEFEEGAGAVLSIDDEHGIPLGMCHRTNIALLSELSLPFLAKAAKDVVSTFIRVVHSFNGTDANVIVSCLALALDATLVTQSCSALAQTLIVNSVAVQKSFGKLTYVLMRLFRNLFADGFCDSGKSAGDGSGDDDDDGDEDMEMRDGTGIGEGQGQNDVSDQIENEEQVLGLQNDEDKDDVAPPDEKNEPKDANDGVEMTNDFDGEMTDIKEDEDRKDDNEEDKDVDDEEELDREMGDMEDDEENVVDEKMWGDDSDDDEDEKDTPDEDEKFEKDSAVKGEALEDEMRTKEEEEEGADDKNNGDKKDDDSKREDDPQNQQQNDEPEDQNDGDGDDDEIDEINEDKEENYEERHMDAPVQQEEDMAGSDDDQKDDEDMDVDLENAEQEQEDAGEGGESGDDEEGKEDQDPMDLEPDPAANDEKNDDEDENDDDAGIKAGVMELDEEQEDEDEGQADMKNEEENDDDDEKLDKPVDDVDDGMGASAVAIGNDGNQGINGDEEEDDSQDGEKDHDNSNEKDEEDSPKNEVEEQDDAEAEDKKNNEENSASGLDSKQDQGGDQNDSGELRPQEVPQNDQDESSEQQQQRKQPQRPESVNPYRRPGDARKEWHRRLNITDEELDDDKKGDDKPQDEEEDKPQPQQQQQQSEYMFEDDREDNQRANGEQALARAKEDEDQEGEDGDDDDGGAVEDEEKDSNNVLPDQTAKDEINEEIADGNDDSDDDQGPENTNNNASSVPSDNMQMQERDADKNPEDDTAKDADEEDVEMSLAEEDAQDQDHMEGIAQEDIEGDLDGEGDEDMKKSEFSDEEEDEERDEETDESVALELTAADLAASREAITHLLASRSADDIDRAHTIWSRIDAITASGSQRLCEQLRLILEPTLATKLKGDFRTGKRINMRKIIPYIASSYRKDKIWLRRKKPSKRQYQIMIAIDDSESMQPRDPTLGSVATETAAANSSASGLDSVHATNARLGAGSVALEALALIGNALTRLEVGEIAVASFGADCQMLHPFSKPFTADAGAEVVSSFTFAQKETDMVKMVDWTTQALDIARDSAGHGTAEQVQLVFVVTDALGCNPKSLERIRKMTREASTKDCMFVLLIIDTAEKPIIEMQRVTYENGKPKLKHYLDDIPFDYYVTVRDITALPEVLGDSLRQWWESINK